MVLDAVWRGAVAVEAVTRGSVAAEVFCSVLMVGRGGCARVIEPFPSFQNSFAISNPSFDFTWLGLVELILSQLKGYLRLLALALS
jgi:hypothetical protein